MNFLEKDLEEIVHSTDQKLIRERGLICYSYDQIFRQLHLGKYGIADLITIEYDAPVEVVTATVYELKQDLINQATFLQAIGYCKGVETVIRDIMPGDWKVEYNVVLIGKRIDLSNNFCYCERFMENLSFYTYKYEFDGIHFRKESDYSLTDSGLDKDIYKHFLQTITSNCVTYPKGNTYALQSTEDKDDMPF